jgi:hypothetical protein
MNKELKLLDEYQRLINNSILNIKNLIENKSIINIAIQSKEHENKEIDSGFNLFNIISDTYYKENFHSDILKSLLSPNEKHNEGDKYLNQFIIYIKSLGASVNPLDYKHSEVFREKGRIDILIKDELTKKSIIIENKINGAFDMHRQLPRYYNNLTNEGFDVDAIVYLLLNDEKKPSVDGWNDFEINKIDEKLIVVSTCKKSENDLLHGWIYKCEKMTNNVDALFVLRQYGKLLELLGGNIMNKQISEKFFETMLEGENFNTALSLKTMIEELASYRIERILDEFRNNPKPFYQVRKTRTDIVRFENCEIDNSKYSIDICAEIDKYKFQFWDINFSNEGENPAKILLQKLNYFDCFVPVDYWFERIFKFPSEEKELYDFIREIKKRLK